ncbi:MAG: 6-phosphogluconolactonase [Acidimicrobiales bacterium]
MTGPDRSSPGLRVVAVEDAAAVAATGAGRLGAAIRQTVAAHGRCRLAVSGGSTPAPVFARLAGWDLPWDRVTVWQVDERVVAAGRPDRNLTMIEATLGTTAARIVAIPVDGVPAGRLADAADRYAALLPDRFDLVHLGLGADGHTASLVPDDPVVSLDDRLVGTTRPYQGHRRVTLTYRALARADRLLWLVAGAGKADAVRALLTGDGSIPAGRVVRGTASVLVADRASLALPPCSIQDRPDGRSGTELSAGEALALRRAGA